MRLEQYVLSYNLHGRGPVPDHLMGQVIDKGEHEAVRDGDHELGAAGREAKEDAGRQEHEQEGCENCHDNAEHRLYSGGRKERGLLHWNSAIFEN